MNAQPLRLVDTNGKRRPARRKLTAAWVRDLAPPASGRLTVYDSVQPGLAVVVTAKGSRSYYLIRKVHGRARRVRLADGTIPVDQARKMAAQETVNQNNGVDTVQERRDRRNSVATLGELYTTYAAERERRPSTIVGDDNRWSLIANWHGRRLDAVTPEMVANLHAKIGANRGKVVANRTVQMIRRLYRWAKRRRLYAGENPAEGIELNREVSREEFVKPGDLPQLLDAIDAEPEWADYFRLLLLTGARRSAMAAMRWADVDLDDGSWTIQRADSKNKAAIVVPLVDEAVDRLKRRQAAAKNDAVYVFPSKVTSGHIVSPTDAWKRIRTAAGLPNITMHDLRRTCGSYLAAAGVPLNVIGRALGHKSQASTQIYARLDLGPVRDALNSVISPAMGGKKTTKRKSKTKRKTKAKRRTV